MSFLKRSDDARKRKFVHSLNSALEGVIHTLKTERNMRIHFTVGSLVLVMGVALKLSNIEFLFLCLAVFFVLVCEMFNTAIEYAVDLINDEFHPLAKVIKDIAAGAVFVASVNAVITGYILIISRLAAADFLGKVSPRIHQYPSHFTVIAIVTVVAIVIGIKLLRKERHLFRGGMPSGHSAVAFSVWTIVTLLTKSPVISGLVFALAFLVARSRIIEGVHNIWEVIAGSSLGILITILIFQLLLK